MNDTVLSEAVLLAGGNGTRLKPFTHYTSKHLLPVGDVPMITYPIKNLQLIGVDRLIIVINPCHEDQWHNFLDSANFDVEIKVVMQQEALGIPQAISICKPYLHTDNFYVALGDNIILSSNFLNKFKKLALKFPAVMSTFATECPSEFGIAEFDDDYNLQRIIEKPKTSKSNRAVVGFYKFDRSFFKRFQKTSISIRNEYEISDILNSYHHENKLGIINSDSAVDYWLDMGTLDSMRKASKFLESFKLEVDIFYKDFQ